MIPTRIWRATLRYDSRPGHVEFLQTGRETIINHLIRADDFLIVETFLHLSQAYHKMKDEHQERRDNLIDDLDQEELIENGRAKKV